MHLKFSVVILLRKYESEKLVEIENKGHAIMVDEKPRVRLVDIHLKKVRLNQWRLNLKDDSFAKGYIF